MQTKHTPGQWKATGLEIRHENRSLILANVYPHLPANQSREEAEANAKLIAAAPDILQNTIEQTIVIESSLKNIFDGITTDAKTLIPLLETLLSGNRTAIKKATE